MMGPKTVDDLVFRFGERVSEMKKFLGAAVAGRPEFAAVWADAEKLKNRNK
jgi:hypothetical protein